MSFAIPELLWLAAISVPVLAAFLWWSWRKRRALIRQFVQSRLLAQLTIGVSTSRQKLRLALAGFSASLILLALARPQWGFAWEEVHEQGLDALVAIDTSRSMLAQDIAPNRLTRAKLAAEELQSLASHDRFGLIAFAGSAFLQSPLTLDDAAFRQSVDALDVNVIPVPGTALAAAIQTADESFNKVKNSGYKVLVLFTDGEDWEAGVVEAAQKAADDGIRIFTVGLGTPAGELIRIPGPDGQQTFLKDDEGRVVKSRLNEKLLRQVAAIGHGFYIHLIGSQTMERLYQNGLAPLPKSNLASRRFQRLRERFQWPLALAVLTLFLELFVPVRRRPRAPAAGAGKPAKPFATAVMAALLLASAGVARASTRQAERAFARGQYSAAEREYEKLLLEKPADTRLQYDAGVAAYQARRFAAAARHFDAATQAPDLGVQQKAFYNLGNAFFRLGQSEAGLDKRIAFWQQALKQYEGALQLDPRDADAEFNRELVKKKLEQLQQQKKQQEQQRNQKSNSHEKQPPQSSKPNPNDSKKSSAKSPPQKSPRPDSGAPPRRQPQNNGANSQGQSRPNSSENAAEKKAEEDAASRAAAYGEMTPEQARQLLDSHKDEEKPLRFAPLEKTNPSLPHSGKTW